MSHLYKSNTFALGLFLAATTISIITVLGLSFSPGMFGTFSWLTFSVIASIAGYMLYNIIKISHETIKEKKDS